MTTKKPEAPPAKRKRIPMLPPDNPITILPEGTDPTTITQKMMKELYNLQTEYESVRGRYYARRKQVEKLVTSGASVQPGTYKIRHSTRLARRPSYRQVVIDLKGEAYQQRILAATPPHAYFKVTIH